MKTILISVFMILTTLSFGQDIDKFEPFNSCDYPKEKYQIMSDSFRLNKILIKIRQVKTRNPNSGDKTFFYCRAWLTVSKENKSIFQRFFKSIEPLGGCSGLFISPEQPRKDYFVVSKLGDYDGRIFIFDSFGNVTEKLGGVFFVSNDKRYLFSDWDSDGSGLTVFDFIKGRCLFSEIIEPTLNGWYFQDNKYVSPADQDVVDDNSIMLINFDLVTNKLVISKSSKNYLKIENKLPSYNLEISNSSCNCGL
jgi:hypothetical protein